MASAVSEISDDSPLPANATAAIILFTATWHEACAVNGPMDQLLNALASSSSSDSAAFRRCDAEEQSALAEQFGIEQVPTFCLLTKPVGAAATAVSWKVVSRFTGDDPAAVSVAVQSLLQASEDNPAVTAPPKQSVDEQKPIKERLDSLIRSQPVMLFMKGSPAAPRCGFSRQIVEILQEAKLSFGHFDILTDETVRQKLKEHSDWPTYPQLYANGELVGGLDIVKEMVDDPSMSLAEQLGVESPTERLEKLVKRSPVMLFMKGLPSQPRCGFSRTIVEILQGYENVPLDTFDILTDEDVRQGLKEYSKWPTYPQLYVNGELVGGLDIVQEMHEDGSLRELLDSI